MKVVKTRRYLYGLTGYPLGHSISPVIHKALFELCGIAATYLMVEASPEDLEKVFAETLSGLRGFNVTIPHKINIIKYLDELSPRAELFGAVRAFRRHFRWQILNLQSRCFFAEAVEFPE